MESASATPDPEVPTRVIEPPKGWQLPDFRELWDRRDLLYFLAKRDVAVRYKQAAIGFAWAVLQPLLLAGVFAVFFGHLAKVDAPAGIPYAVYVIAGFVMWLFFATAMQECALSTIGSSTLISKVYFPRLTIPIASVLPPVIDFLIGFVIVILVAAGYGFGLRIQLLLFPFALLLTVATILGAGLWLSALNVKYRDVVLLVPFITQLGLFITPVVYPLQYVPVGLQPLYVINPMAGILEFYRWMILPTAWPGYLLLISGGAAILLLVTGAMYFKHAEKNFADVI